MSVFSINRQDPKHPDLSLISLILNNPTKIKINTLAVQLFQESMSAQQCDYKFFNCFWNQNPERVGMPLSRVCVVIVCQKLGGLGDLAFSIKMKDVLFQALPKKCEVTLHPYSSSELNAFKEFRPIPFIEPMEMAIYKAAKFPTLVLNGPVLTHKLPINQTANTTIWNLLEYSWGNNSKDYYKQEGTLYVTGLREGELGIFCDEELYQNQKALTKKGKENDPELIHNLDQDLLRALLLQKKNSHLYFGYTANQGRILNFILALIQNHQNDSTDIDICLVSKKFSNYSFFDYSLEKILKDKKLEAYGVKNFEIWEFDNESMNFSLNFQLETGITQGKKVRVIILNKLNRQDFRKMIVAAKSPILVTGNQSLSETNSAGKAIIYDVMPHTENLKRRLEELTAFMPSIAAKKAATVWGLMKSDWHDSKTIEAVKLTLDPEVRRCFRLLSRHIYKKHNLGKRMIKMVIEHFFSKK